MKIWTIDDQGNTHERKFAIGDPLTGKQIQAYSVEQWEYVSSTDREMACNYIRNAILPRMAENAPDHIPSETLTPVATDTTGQPTVYAGKYLSYKVERTTIHARAVMVEVMIPEDARALYDELGDALRLFAAYEARKQQNA